MADPAGRNRSDVRMLGDRLDDLVRAPLTLTWEKFEDAAWEAGISRRYGGIHWLYGDLISRELGRKMGERSFDTARAEGCRAGTGHGRPPCGRRDDRPASCTAPQEVGHDPPVDRSTEGSQTGRSAGNPTKDDRTVKAAVTTSGRDGSVASCTVDIRG